MTRVLVVDDVSTNVTVMTWMLVQQGYAVTPAMSGQQALDIVAVERPDIILLDVSMPEMSGIEVCRRLKSDPVLRLIPIILVTARTTTEDIVEGLNSGADDYITKPVTRELLAARMRSALRIKSIYDELAESAQRLRREMAERAKAEEELRHAQKMELVGQLAGGIAHEFNNLLQTIEGYTAYAMEGLAEGDPRHEDLQQVLKASGRAASLTRQLLGFSRCGTMEKKAVDPNRAVTDLAKMIRPLLGTQIQLDLALELKSGEVMADPASLRQALLNLVFNARDAMPSGGRLSLKTERKMLPGDGGDERLRPYAAIHVTDTGCGMSDETRKRIFEPFYTTKESGKGTGLGLANVYGVVRQHDGLADVASALGKGTTFTICLPVIQEPREAEIREDLEENARWPVLT